MVCLSTVVAFDIGACTFLVIAVNVDPIITIIIIAIVTVAVATIIIHSIVIIIVVVPVIFLIVIAISRLEVFDEKGGKWEEWDCVKGNVIVLGIWKMEQKVAKALVIYSRI